MFLICRCLALDSERDTCCEMACKGCLECVLRLLNFLLTLVGLAMVGYGIYLFVIYKQSSNDTLGFTGDVTQFGRPLMMTVSLNSNILDDLPKAWYAFTSCFSRIPSFIFVSEACYFLFLTSEHIIVFHFACLVMVHVLLVIAVGHLLLGFF